MYLIFKAIRVDAVSIATIKARYGARIANEFAGSTKPPTDRRVQNFT